MSVAQAPEADPENVVWHPQSSIASPLLHILSKSLLPSLPPGEYQMLFNTYLSLLTAGWKSSLPAHFRTSHL